MTTLAAPPPEHCPGTASEQAGKSEACAGCPNQVCSNNELNHMLSFENESNYII